MYNNVFLSIIAPLVESEKIIASVHAHMIAQRLGAGAK
jgi:hypothetical protein